VSPCCFTYVVPKEKSLVKLHHKGLILKVVWGGIEPPTQGFSLLSQSSNTIGFFLAWDKQIASLCNDIVAL
jgi:hypothetical protein